MAPPSASDVLIIGGGFAGLCCARRLQEVGIPNTILEASDDIGGRARTDSHEGFLLDRGFQVLLTAYPEARRVLHYQALDLRPFEPGALIRYRGRFRRLVDPWRRPRYLVQAALAPTATLGDKLRIARLRGRLARLSLDEIYRRPEQPTLQYLQEAGFSRRVIDSFFRPFLGGVFLDPALETTSRMFEFVFRMFGSGDAALPAKGMGAVARQLAIGLPPASVRTNARVERLEQQGEQWIARLAAGEELRATTVVLATNAPAAARLLGDSTAPRGRSVCCLYYAADRPPLEEPILVLNGEGKGPVNNLCVPSQVAPTYAPAGQSLVSATVLGSPAMADKLLESSVREQLVDWFGPAVTSWRHLRTYRIEYALPVQATLPPANPERWSARTPGLVVCGDYVETGSIQGAMVSGKRAADAIVAASG